VIRDEADKDYQLAGVSQDVEADDSIWTNKGEIAVACF
jgi:hypothetical protein